MKPLISVVTVCFNAVKDIEKTILSVINQTYENIEYIIIDGGSTDGTVDIIKKYADRITYWISEPDKGIYDAMNKGIKVATGGWINFMNAGDEFAENDVLKNIFDISDYNKYAVVHGDIYQNKRTPECVWKDTPFYEKSLKRYTGMNICHQAMFTKSEWIRRFNFNLKFKLCADYNMMMSIYKAGGTFHHIDTLVTIYDTYGFSNTNWKQTLREEMEICGIKKGGICYYAILFKHWLSHNLK